MRLRLACLLLALPLASIARADTFEYTFSSNNNGVSDPVSFDVFTDGPATFNTILPAAECHYVPYGNCQGIYIDQTVNQSPFGNYDSYTIAYDFNGGLSYEGALRFLTDDDFTVGSHPVAFTSGNLVIRDLPAATTPEPASFALLGTGLLGLAGTLRRRA